MEFDANRKHSILSSLNVEKDLTRNFAKSDLTTEMPVGGGHFQVDKSTEFVNGQDFSMFGINPEMNLSTVPLYQFSNPSDLPMTGNGLLQPSTLHPLNVGFVVPFDHTMTTLESKFPDHLAPTCSLPMTTYPENDNRNELIMGPLRFQGFQPQPDLHNYLAFTQPPFSLQHCFPPSNVRTTDEARYQNFQYEQLQRFPRLPLDAHRKIQQMGNEIIHYFEARLIHIENPSQVDTFDSHVVFLKSPSTFQHWVMAFVKEQNRVVVKFNRLLTVHVKVSLRNPLTIDIEPSKSPNRRSDEQFVFNFENQRICAEFLRVLNICKKEVWTRRGLDVVSGQSHSVIPNSTFQGTGRTRSNLRQRQNLCDEESLPLSAFGDLELSPRKKFKGLGSLLNGTKSSVGQKILDELASAPPKFMRFPYRMKFILKNSAVLSLRKDNNNKYNNNLVRKETNQFEWVNLGMGTLKIWGNDDSFDQLDFIGKLNQEAICSHPIYSWNTLNYTIDEEAKEFFCTWNAAADILNAPTSLPVIRNFKVNFPTGEIASSFKTAFEESCNKASNPEIIIKSHQNVPNVEATSDLP